MTVEQLQNIEIKCSKQRPIVELWHISNAYLESCQISKIVKIINGCKPLFSQKNFILDVWQRSECTSTKHSNPYLTVLNYCRKERTPSLTFW